MFVVYIYLKKHLQQYS